MKQRLLIQKVESQKGAHPLIERLLIDGAGLGGA
jgi:hypothetical protein